MIPRQALLLIPRLGTCFEGELVATRDAIGRVLQTAGLDWHDLAKACGTAAPEPAPPRASSAPPGRPPCFGDIARACRDLDRGRLSPRERSFVADMIRRGYAFRPTPPQAAWIARIYDRLKPRAAA